MVITVDMLERLQKAIDEMPSEEFNRRYDAVVARGEHKKYAALEKMLRGDSVIIEE